MSNTVRRSDIGNFYEVRDSDGDLIADYVPDQTLAYHFAAAPELLEAIRQLMDEAVSVCDGELFEFPRLVLALDKARDAVTKAEGGGS